MSFNIDKLSNDMESLYNNIILKSNILSLDSFKEHLLEKQLYVECFINSLSKINQGTISRDVIENMKVISNDFKELYDNFDDKLMIFIVGNGNVGKSTLLNSLVGKEVAKTNFLPTTWKIDVYSPELGEDEVIIKYINGNHETLSINKAKNKISEEEEKSKESNKVYKAKLKEELKNIKNKEQIEEIKRYLGKKYIYKSNISEVRWPVKSNWILERCLLVDTPGLNQELNSLEQLGDANSYYHKADGVIWILNGTTIASETPNTLLKELDNSLENVGGLRDNIVGVINRIDLLKKNGGQEAVNKVYNDAVKHFGDKFTDIIGVSAKQAYEGINNNDKDMIKESGILELQNAIRNIFLSKANTVKGNAKIQGSSRLIKNTESILNTFKKKIEDYEDIYISKEENLKIFRQNFINSIKEDLANLINNYLNEVDKRVDAYIDELSNGKGIDFIKNTMYKVNEFESRRNSFIKNKTLEIENNANTWQKLCKISEYKYIQPKATKNDLSINVSINLNNIDTSVFFTPSAEGTLMSGLGNLIGKIGFFFRKNGIKRNLMNTIKSQCKDMEKQLINEIETIVNQNYNDCKNLLNITFKEILFDFKEIENVKLSITKLENEIVKSSSDHTFEEIVGISGRDEYFKSRKMNI
ncbi:hypothetical protein EAI30_08955 [Romboutsia ilealis]|nr:hypothetical protein [Romboutsia ilealis]